jgi:ABC-2 type transport system permease protein
MNIQSNSASGYGFDQPGNAPAAMSATRPLYWSVRRELAENRSIYIGPLGAAGVYLLGYFISLIWLPGSVRAVEGLDPAHQRLMLAMPYSHAAMLIMLTAFLVGIFYSLDALHGERKDRSILFWKSLPVSDLTTVLSKASIPLVVLPVLVVTITVVLQLVMRVVSLGVLFVSGAGAATLWTRLPLFEMELVTLYGTVVMVLWHAPIYCWFLLVSGWARRATFLWAVLPPAAVGIFEYVAFHSSHLGSVLHARLFGFADIAFELKAPDGTELDAHFIPLAQLAPGRFLSSPSLWVGLILAALCLAAAVRLRRYRGPI